MTYTIIRTRQVCNHADHLDLLFIPNWIYIYQYTYRIICLDMKCFHASGNKGQETLRINP